MVTEYRDYECDICRKNYTQFDKALDCELRGFIEPRIVPGSVFFRKIKILGYEDCESVFFVDGQGKKAEGVRSHYPIFNVHRWFTQLWNGKCSLATKPRVNATSLDEPDFLYELNSEQFELVKEELVKRYSPANNPMRIVRGEKSWFFSEIQRLRNAIEHAVKSEDYERAALLRDRIEEQLLKR